MKKSFLKYTLTALSLSVTLPLYAALTTSTNSNPGNAKPIVQNQAASTQDATNSLIQWLNANFVTGTPLQFPQSMKGNLQNILATHGISNLDWQLTSAITFVSLKGQVPNNTKSQNVGAQATASNQNVSLGMLSQDISSADLVPKITDTDNYVAQKLSQFNIGKLLSTTTIAPRSEDDKNAQILMSFVSGLASSVGPLSQQMIKRDSGPINNFQQEYGVYLAQQSVGLNILYTLINERLVQKGLGTQLGGPQADMSPLALDQYMATRRLNVNDPQGWLAQLSDATPAQVAKEQLMLMAEMRYEMYLTRRSLENMQTLMAVQELQNNDSKKGDLSSLKSEISGSTLPAAIN